MSRGEVLAFAGGFGGAVVGWTLGEKARAGGVGALVGFAGGITAAYLLDKELLPAPPEPKPALAGYDPFNTEAAWYYVDSWAWFVGGWTPHRQRGPWWATDFGATQEEDTQAFDVHMLHPSYLIVRRFRWTSSGWVKENLSGDMSRKWSI
jgi:hypothetical protein